MIKTTYLTQEQVQRRCSQREFAIDAASTSLGRVASVTAFLLQNKLDPIHSDHFIHFPKVIVYNLKNCYLTGKKENQEWHFPSTYAVKRLKFAKTESTIKEIFRKIVLGMLPKTNLRKRMIQNLFYFHETPEVLKAARKTKNVLGINVSYDGDLI